MSARQLIVLAIAAIAAIGALLLIRGAGGQRADPVVAQAEAIVGEQVLIVSRDIPQGAALAPSDLEVATYSPGAIGPQFVRLSDQPSAQAEYVGAVTRRAFSKGEPIVQGAVLQPEGRGFLAAQLEPGYRAISIEVESYTTAGGYIQPNDHVDVIQTAEVETKSGRDVVVSEIVLQDIRVLALDDAVQTQTSGDAPTRAVATVAVLEMTAQQARELALADAAGDITLALRGVEVETVGMGQARPTSNAGSPGAVRVHAFGSIVEGSQ